MVFTRRLMTALLLLLVLLGPAGLVAHHHSDQQGESHCIACLLLVSCVAALPALLIVPAAPLLQSRLAPTACLIPLRRHVRLHLQRAPPA